MCMCLVDSHHHLVVEITVPRASPSRRTLAILLVDNPSSITWAVAGVTTAMAAVTEARTMPPHLTLQIGGATRPYILHTATNFCIKHTQTVTV